MAGRRPDALKPTLIITCGDAATKKRVEKTFKSQGWLQEVLKANSIMFVALVAKTPLSAGPASDNCSTVKLDESYAIQITRSGATTSCGLGLVVSDADSRLTQYCTLGGLLLVKGALLGLTAGHLFSKFKHNVMPWELSEAAKAVEDSSDEGGSTKSGDPFVFNDSDDDDTDDDSVTSGISFYENTRVSSSFINGLPCRQHENLRTFLASTEWHHPQAAILPAASPRHVSSVEEPLNNHDWALLEALPSAVTSMPNKIAHIDQRSDILIEEIVSGRACGEVTVTVAGIGPQLGFLHSSPATMKVDDSVLEVQLITLEHVLPLGSSGAWVILEDRLCGYIIAVRQDIPWAYMVAIEPVLEEIRRKLDTDDVRLPTAGDIESLAIASEVSVTELPDEEQEEIPALSPEVNQLSMPSEGSKRLREFDLAELPSTIEKCPPAELPDGPIAQRSYLLHQREDEFLNDKFSIQDEAEQTPINYMSLPLDDLPLDERLRSNNDLRGSTVGQLASGSPNAIRAHEGSLISAPQAEHKSLVRDYKHKPEPCYTESGAVLRHLSYATNIIVDSEVYLSQHVCSGG
ncbi:MAG: hypothetical protein Q9225_006385 [Loekoesia sp. 1 TL-2023]